MVAKAVEVRITARMERVQRMIYSIYYNIGEDERCKLIVIGLTAQLVNSKPEIKWDCIPIG